MNDDLKVREEECRKTLEIYDFTNRQTDSGFLMSLLNDQTTKIEEIVKSNLQERYDAILAWICEYDAFDTHVDVLGKLGHQHSSSGQWLLHDGSFQEWQASSSGVFTLRGGIGTGKSSLTAITIEHLFKTTNANVAFYYCTRDQDRSSARTSNEDVMSLALCLLRQLCQKGPGHQATLVLNDLYSRRTQRLWSRLRLSEPEMSDLIVQAIETCQEAIVIIDAVDECACSYQLLRFLRSISLETPKLKLLFSSRPQIDIASVFEQLAELRVEDHTVEDLSKYLHYEIFSSDRRDNSIVPNKEQASHLYEILNNRASGM